MGNEYSDFKYANLLNGVNKSFLNFSIDVHGWEGGDNKGGVL
jgi:hypothetical protein